MPESKERGFASLNLKQEDILWLVLKTNFPDGNCSLNNLLSLFFSLKDCVPKYEVKTNAIFFMNCGNGDAFFESFIKEFANNFIQESCLDIHFSLNTVFTLQFLWAVYSNQKLW